MSEDPPPMSDDKTGKVYEAHLSRDDSVGPIYFIPFPSVWTTEPRTLFRHMRNKHLTPAKDYYVLHLAPGN